MQALSECYQLRGDVCVCVHLPCLCLLELEGGTMWPSLAASEACGGFWIVIVDEHHQGEMYTYTFISGVSKFFL